MKPAPPDHLLGPGQTWIVVQADRWAVVSGKECNARWFDGEEDVRCRLPAIIFDREAVFANGDILCEKHMGYHRWIDNGVVMQWRADPPWVYGPTKPKMPPQKR